MSRWDKGPPSVKYPTGPNCGGCPFRSTSFGYAPLMSPGLRITLNDGVPSEAKTKIKTDYLFLFEALGREEVQQGMAVVGGTGAIFNELLRKNSPIKRSVQTVANTVRCRPVQWEVCDECQGYGTVRGSGVDCPQCYGNKQVPSENYRQDHVNTKPSAAQIRECASRYTDDLIERFDGMYIIALGKTAAEYALGRSAAVNTVVGRTFEPGKLKECENCEGEGKEKAERQVKCSSCKGRGTSKCECGGVTKHRKSCKGNLTWGSEGWLPCKACNATKTVTKHSTRNCQSCSGAGQISTDPGNPYVSEKLKDHQLLYITYHPAALMYNKTLREEMNAYFSRMATLKEDLEAFVDVEYEDSPSIDTTPWVETSDLVSIDLETRGSLDPLKDGSEIECVSATNRVNYGMSLDEDDPRVSQLLSRPRIVGQNFVLYDQWWLYHKGHLIPESTKIIDTRYLGKLINPDTPNSLAYLSTLPWKKGGNPAMRGYWKASQDYKKDKRKVGGLDVAVTLRVLFELLDEIDKRGQTSLVNDYIIPMSRVVFDMRVGGMKIDHVKMKETRDNILVDILNLRDLLPWEKAGGAPGTEGQHAKVAAHLYKHFSLPVQKHKGKVTTNFGAREELLSLLESNHKSVQHLDDDVASDAIDFINNFSELKGLSKLESSFLRYRLSGVSKVYPALNMGGSAHSLVSSTAR